MGEEKYHPPLSVFHGLPQILLVMPTIVAPARANILGAPSLVALPPQPEETTLLDRLKSSPQINNIQLTATLITAKPELVSNKITEFDKNELSEALKPLAPQEIKAVRTTLRPDLSLSLAPHPMEEGDLKCNLVVTPQIHDEIVTFQIKGEVGTAEGQGREFGPNSRKIDMRITTDLGLSTLIPLKVAQKDGRKAALLLQAEPRVTKGQVLPKNTQFVPQPRNQWLCSRCSC